MPKSIAEMRQSPHVGRPTGIVRICVAGKLQAELESVDQQLLLVMSEADVAAQETEQGKPRRAGQRGRLSQLQQQADELAARSDEILDQMEDHMVDVGLMAIESGDWRQWCLEHPAREDERRDQRALAGVCDADALVAELETYVVSLNEQPLQAGDWEFVSSNAADAALLEAAAKVVSLHNVVVSLGKSRRVWLSERTNANSSSSQKQSGSQSGA